jgi:hypothetical protein
VAGSTLTSSYALVDFAFATPVGLTASTRYGFAVVQGTASWSNAAAVGGNVDCNVSPMSSFGRWDIGTGAWESVSSGRAPAGRVYQYE